jgi:hypothetical protein
MASPTARRMLPAAATTRGAPTMGGTAASTARRSASSAAATHCPVAESYGWRSNAPFMVSILIGTDTCSWVTIHWPFIFWSPEVTRTQ